ncbi:MAG: DUF1697 domain-containing protein [Chloroflexota bacterium]
MSVHIALLRAVNLGGRGKVSMADLRRVLSDLGFAGARSLLNSGNLVFSSDGRPSAEIELLLERAAAEQLGLRTDFFVRTADDWSRVIARNPFPDEAAHDPAHLLVIFLKGVPDASAVHALQSAANGPEVVRADGEHLYVTHPAGIGRSRLTAALIETRLAVRGTGRNWNTILKLKDLAGSE